VASATASQTIIMDYSELQFILAARKRVYFVGDAAEYYKMGVQNLLNIIVIDAWQLE
jgi:hypothetical protein